MSNKEALFTSGRTRENSRDEWMTPWWLWEILNDEFNFNLDPAATDENTLCDSWYTKEENGLIQPWWGNVYLNCPYSQLIQWASKAYKEMTEEKNVNVLVMLIAARTDTRAFWKYFRHGEIRLLPGRLKFEHPNGAKNSAPFPSCLAIFHKGMDREPSVKFWEIREPK